MSGTFLARKSYNDFANPRLETHMTFVCPECGVEFEFQQDWRRHLNEEHDYLHKTPSDFDFKVISDSFHECQVCHKWVANANRAIALLQYHRFLHLPFNRTYRCRHCKGGFTRKRALCEHLYRFHSRQIMSAEDIGQSDNEIGATTVIISTTGVATDSVITNSLSLQQEHKQLLNVEERLRDPRVNTEFYLRFICPQCGKDIDKYDQWLRHLDYHPSTSNDMRMHRISGSRNHYCLQCRKLLYTNEQPKLKRHRFTHLPFRLYFKCAFCLVKKSFKSEIFRHFIYAHPRHFNEAKAFIKKPVEWGAKINDRLNTELDAILRRYKDNDSLLQKKGHPTMQQRQKEQEQNIRIDCGKSNVGIIKDYHKADQQNILIGEAITATANTSQPTESTTEEDFEDLCADIFEAIEEESDVALHRGDEKKENHIKSMRPAVRNLQQQETLAREYPTKTEHELIVSIEINTMKEEIQLQSYNIVRTPSRKRFRQSIGTENEANIESLDQVITYGNNLSSQCEKNKSESKLLLEASIHYLCPECGKEFAQQSNWRTHVFNDHNIKNAIQTSFQMLENEQSYLCLDCMDVQHTTKYAELQRHRFMHMPFQAYLKCKICNRTKSSKPKMLQHLEVCHDYKGTKVEAAMPSETKKFYPCKICSKYFITQELLRLHLHHTSVCAEVCENVELSRNSNSSKEGQIAKNCASTLIANNVKLLYHLRKAHKRMQSLHITGQQICH